MSPIRDPDDYKDAQAERRERRRIAIKERPCIYCGRMDLYGTCYTCARDSVWLMTPEQRARYFGPSGRT